jgi:hypothetical protein
VLTDVAKKKPPLKEAKGSNKFPMDKTGKKSLPGKKGSKKKY